jgi:hypothetical protein
MKKTISGISLLLATLPVWAQEAAEVPIPSAADASPVAMIVFVVLFIVLIGGFFGYMWLQGQKNQKDGQ